MSAPPPRPVSAASGIPGLPPRPDLPDRSSRPLLVVLALCVLVAIALSALAIDSLLDEPLRASPASPTSAAEPTPEPEPSPSASPPAATAAEIGPFRFLDRTSQGPVRWNPCEAVTYAVDARDAPGWVVRDLERALGEVSDATGIRFRSKGDTAESFALAHRRMRFDDRGPDVVILWVEQERYDAIRKRLSSRRPTLAFALPIPGDYGTLGEYVGAVVVMSERTFASPASRGFAYRWSHGVVLLHELGHVMGLAHVKRDAEQLMYAGPSPVLDVTSYGTGDLEGLRRLGADRGCPGADR